MTATEIIAHIKPLGLDSYKKVILKHGVQEPCFGVKVEELKKIQKKVGQDYRLALELYETGVYDAMYLAGLIADDKKMTKADLKRWLKQAVHGPIRSSTVPWVASESLHGMELALEWIESKDKTVAAAGWNTLSSLVSIKADADLDLGKLKKLLEQVGKTLKKQPAGKRHASVAYAMNGFVIAVGTYVAPLTKLALETAEAIGVFEVDMGDTACKVPEAAERIRKAQARGAIGKKRASAKC